MKPKRCQMIPRTRVPNLADPSPHLSKLIQPPQFFSKISNSFKLLQDPVAPSQVHRSTSNGFNLQKKNFLSDRLKQLSMHKTRSASLMDKIKTPSRLKPLLRDSSFQGSLPRHRKGESEITGSKLFSVPLEDIVAMRERLEVAPPKRIDTLSDSQEEIQRVEVERQEWKSVKGDVGKWAEMLVGGQNHLYEQYDRKLMEKVRIYRARQFKIVSESMWK